MNHKNFEQARFVEEQLLEARHALFAAKTVREIKFIQSKITYLAQQMKTLEKKRK